MHHCTYEIEMRQCIDSNIEELVFKAHLNRGWHAVVNWLKHLVGVLTRAQLEAKLIGTSFLTHDVEVFKLHLKQELD